MSSMIIVFIIGGPFIKFIESHKITGPIRDDGPIGHIFKKEGTPTMGGVFIISDDTWARFALTLFYPVPWFLFVINNEEKTVLKSFIK